MEFFQDMLLPLTAAVTVIYGIYKRLPVFELFLKGAKKATGQIMQLLPALTALLLAVGMLTSSGAAGLLSELLRPLGNSVGIPAEVIPLCLISPLSGSGSIASLQSILSLYSPDSYIGRTASVIAGASETTFYTVAVYYGSAGITAMRHTLPCAMTADIVSWIAASLYCRIL